MVSPTDLVDLLECEHRSALTHALACNVPDAPRPGSRPDAVVTKHGVQHEQNVLEQLKATYDVVEIGQPAPHPDALRAAAKQTLDALNSGAQAVYQAVFFDGSFYGRADFLIAGADGRFEPYDTKLARRASPSAVLQLTAYASALGEYAGPDMHLLLGDGTQHTYRVNDFRPLLTRLRRRLDERLAKPARLPDRLWDDERPACATCRFAQHCATGRDTGRDLSLVAGMRSDQRRKLVSAGIATIDDLAVAETRPQNLSPSSFESLRAQAKLQVQQDRTNKISYEVIGPDALAELPAPSEGDVFFDMEGDPYVGLEYLFGALTPDRVFTPFWAHDHAEEKKAFESFVDLAVGRLAEHPGAHIYHYAPYELSALKRLAAVHGTRESEVDDLLRAGALVDLYAVVRKALRVSQRSYSIKYLEPLYMPSQREGDVKTAVSSIEAYENYLTTRDPAVLDEIADYNEYDCVSTLELYRFLLRVRDEQGIEPVVVVPDVAVDEVAKQKALERAEQIAALVEPLMDAGHDLLAASVGYHRRETSPAWWDFFRQANAPLSDLETDSACAVPLSVRADEWVEPTGRARTTKRALTLRCDPDRPHPFTSGEEIRLLYPGHVTRSAKVSDDGPSELVLTESVKPGETTTELPIAVLPGPPVRPQPKDEAVAELAEQAVALLPLLPQNPGIDLLLRTPPRRALPQDDDLVQAVIKAVDQLDGGTLAVQGPPGAGKTYLAGRLITHLVARGKTVGVTSNSHKAIENVLGSVDPGIPIAKRPKGKAVEDCAWEQPKDNGALVRWRAEHPGGHLVGGTAWTFANATLRAEPFDVLIIDEAGQFALADAVAVSTCAHNLVLLGDPQQLPQVVQGTHPAGADASALGHLLGDADVIPPHLGYFLDETRRMHPAVCGPVSELSYQGLLHSHPVASTRGVSGIDSGIYLREVDHEHNITSSAEEADAVVDTVRALMGREWTDGSVTRELTDADVLVVAPYNLQVRVTRRRLQKAGYGDVRVGTVDRFQGQEAPVVIMTMTSSSAVDLPRGLDFLLSRNRLNVAISRAQSVAVMICSPRLLDADIRGVDQMRLVAGTIGLIDHMRPWPF
ncbi:TM0106 family RecB-like putative nuclease [Lentzea tibetensis]|uniref:TM0106 family RecB-like putative nuclease n=1 Tax=Lentzea tibetensis TaxID=2591470 RepID=A0A563ETS6_9PSEU|nr:bifunctional RecB family nuclease/DEAD/DEAH box helicase [Lentzea tibetensis]TWP51076.1 TM0106 family RecB-like putative nuclease [Lentzea tibetensis]